MTLVVVDDSKETMMLCELGPLPVHAAESVMDVFSMKQESTDNILS